MPEKNQYIEKAKARIAQWDAEIDKKKAEADEAEADAKIEYQKQLSEMRTQRDKAEARLTELKNATDDAWEDVKSGFDRALDDISSAFTNAATRYK